MDIYMDTFFRIMLVIFLVLQCRVIYKDLMNNELSDKKKNLRDIALLIFFILVIIHIVKGGKVEPGELKPFST